MSFILAACQEIARHFHAGMLVILESTTYPGTTDEVVLPMLAKSGLKPGQDFYLCFSPERVDPGNPKYQTVNIPKEVGDFRFWPAVSHVALYLVIWLVALVVLVTVLAVVVHAIRVRWLSRTLRFVFYLPGALAGASSVLLWLFVLDPTASPVGGLLRLLGFSSFVQVIVPGNLPVIFAVIAFWTGAGGWIVIMYGALNNISAEVIEAARVDGANVVQIAWHIQLPMLRKWISYMGIMSLAAGTQLFVEPQLLSQASNAVVPNDYSLNQLAYQYAFQQNDFNGAAAIPLLLLVVALALSAVFVTRGGLFERE
jgi:multiple sugar transport system permease protein